MAATQWVFNAAMMAGNSQFMIAIIRLNTIRKAYGLHKAATIGSMMAQKALNAAMLNNPVGWVIAGITALVALVVIAITYWDSWGAGILSWGGIALTVFTKFLGPLGLIITAFVAIYKNWENIVTAFSSDGIIGGIKAIGLTLANSLLQPIEWILFALEKMNLISSDKFENFKNFREGMLGGNKATTSFMTTTERVVSKEAMAKSQRAATSSFPTANNFDKEGQFNPAWENFSIEGAGMEDPWEDKAQAQALHLSGEINMTGDGYRNLGGAEFKLNETAIGVNEGLNG